MIRLIPALVAVSCAATAAFAQNTTTTSPSDTPPGVNRSPDVGTTNKSPSATSPVPAERSEAAKSTTTTTTGSPMMMTDAEANQWVNKTIYSNDNQNIGEVAAIKRDQAGNVTEMHADIGGFLGLGETRVRLTPAQFKFEGDRLVLNMSAEEAKNLPAIPK